MFSRIALTTVPAIVTLYAALALAAGKQFVTCPHGIPYSWGPTRKLDRKLPVGFTAKVKCRTCRRQAAGRQILPVDPFDNLFKHEWIQVDGEFGLTWVRGEIVEREPDTPVRGEHAVIFDDTAYGEAGIGMAFHTDGVRHALLEGTFAAPELMGDRFDRAAQTWTHFMATGEAAPRTVPTRRRVRRIKSDGLTQLERMISEDGLLVGDAVVVPHWNVVQKPKHLLASTLMGWLGCDAGTAQRVADAFSALELDYRTAYKAAQDIRRNLAEGVLRYAMLADEVTRVTVSAEENFALDEEAVDEEEPNLAEGFDPDAPGFAPDFLGYHRLDVDEPERDWLERQDPAFRDIYERVLRCTDRQQILDLGQEAFDTKLNRQQARLLWDTFAWKKASIYERNPRVAFLAARILISKDLPAVRRFLGRNEEGLDKLNLKYLYKLLEKRTEAQLPPR